MLVVNWGFRSLTDEASEGQAAPGLGPNAGPLHLLYVCL